MITRIVYTKMWSDDFLVSLTPEEKLVFVYYLTSPAVNIIHFYECSDRQACFDTGVSTEVLAKAKSKFQSAGKILFYKGYVFLRNAAKYENYTGDLSIKGKNRLMNQLNPDLLRWYKVSLRGLKGGLKGTINNKQETISNKPKTRNNTKRVEKIINKIKEKYPIKKI